MFEENINDKKLQVPVPDLGPSYLLKALQKMGGLSLGDGVNEDDDILNTGHQGRPRRSSRSRSPVRSHGSPTRCKSPRSPRSPRTPPEKTIKNGDCPCPPTPNPWTRTTGRTLSSVSLFHRNMPTTTIQKPDTSARRLSPPAIRRIPWDEIRQQITHSYCKAFSNPQ